MSNHVCPNCGQKVLPVATRCPRCGLPIESQFILYRAPAPKAGRVRLALFIIGAVVVVALAGRFEKEHPAPPPIQLPAVVVESTPPGPVVPPVDSQRTATDSALPAPVTSAPAPAESLTRTLDSTPAAVPAAAATMPPAEAVPPKGTVRRYAATWINVRSGRGNSATVIRILRPGDPVLVDSLVRGWYRVIASGEAVGYLDRRFLDTLPSLHQP
jgi:hypothetical protein